MGHFDGSGDDIELVVLLRPRGGIFGQRRVYKIGVALYAADAGLGAISSSFMELLLARAVMAVGLAMALPMSTAILAVSFDSKRRGQMLGLFASAIAVAGGAIQ